MPVIKPKIIGRISDVKGVEEITTLFRDEINKGDPVYVQTIIGKPNWALSNAEILTTGDLPAVEGSGKSSQFSNNNQYLAVAHNTSPFLTIYKKGDGDSFTKLNIAAVPTGNGIDLAFSSDDTYLAVIHNFHPFLTVYKRTGDNFVKLNVPALTAVATSCSFSNDSLYLAITSSVEPYIIVYKKDSNDIFTKLYTGGN